MAVRSLSEFQGASEAPVSIVILVERATRKFAQKTAARRVELKWACACVASRSQVAKDMLPRRSLAPAILNSTIGKPYRLHNTVCGLVLLEVLGQEFIRGARQDLRQCHELRPQQAKVLFLRRRKHRRKTSLYLADDKTAECKSQNTPGPVARDHKAEGNASGYSI
jgi:hypothetical protein